MLQIETLRRKIEWPVPDGNNDIFIDMTTASFIFSGDISVNKSVVITDDFKMRPDLVAKAEYGDSNKLDYICKFNSISNPFSLDSNRVLYIGDADAMDQQMTNNAANTGASSAIPNQASDIRNAFFDPTKLSTQDATRLKYLQMLSATQPNASPLNLPPNFANPGSQEMTVVNGQVIFGNDVVGSKANCPDPISKARAKSKLLENRIFSK